jgi:uncharacterized protein (TIGR03083 family)
MTTPIQATPSYAELVTAVRREGEGIVAAGSLGLDVDVPTCGEWRMTDLLLHVARVYHRAAVVVEERVTAAIDPPPAPDHVDDPVGYLADALDELVHALSGAEADTAVWNWSGSDQRAAFWARRMAHESAIHRFDAQRAHGVAQPLDAELAHDGLDELVDVIAPSVIRRDDVDLPSATYAFLASDDGSWGARLGPDGIERLDVTSNADVTVRGTASALLAAAYGRVPWSSLEVDGDPAALEGWSRAIRP